MAARRETEVVGVFCGGSIVLTSTESSIAADAEGPSPREDEPPLAKTRLVKAIRQRATASQAA